MAKTHTITSNQTATVNVEHGKSTLVLAAGITIGATASDGIQNLLGGGYDKVVYRINGTVETINPSSESGINDDGDGNRLMIGANGRIDAAYGVAAMGDDFTAVNAGTVVGAQATAFLFSGDRFMLENRGMIDGDFAATRSAIITGGTAGTIENTTLGVIHGSIVDQAANTRTTVINAGTLEKSDFWTFAADLGGGNDKVVNRGQMTGDLLMGAGNDVIDLRKGSLSGDARGGIGNDRYVVDGGGAQIAEIENEGTDTVITTIDWKFNNFPDGHFENLKGIGKGNIDLIGNDLANRITGNVGANHIAGGMGDDVLKGGKGRDVFFYSDAEGTDTIVDFTNREDRIDVSGWSAANDFGDVRDMLKVKGKDIWIDNGAERIVLADTTKSELNAADFLF